MQRYVTRAQPFWRLFVVALALTTGACSSYKATSLEDDALFVEGMSHFNRGDYEKAILAFNALLDKNPKASDQQRRPVVAALSESHAGASRFSILGLVDLLNSLASTNLSSDPTIRNYGLLFRNLIHNLRTGLTLVPALDARQAFHLNKAIELSEFLYENRNDPLGKLKLGSISLYSLMVHAKTFLRWLAETEISTDRAREQFTAAIQHIRQLQIDFYRTAKALRGSFPQIANPAGEFESKILLALNGPFNVPNQVGFTFQNEAQNYIPYFIPAILEQTFRSKAFAVRALTAAYESLDLDHALQRPEEWTIQFLMGAFSYSDPYVSRQLASEHQDDSQLKLIAAIDVLFDAFKAFQFNDNTRTRLPELEERFAQFQMALFLTYQKALREELSAELSQPISDRAPAFQEVSQLTVYLAGRSRELAIYEVGDDSLIYLERQVALVFQELKNRIFGQDPPASTGGVGGVRGGIEPPTGVRGGGGVGAVNPNTPPPGPPAVNPNRPGLRWL